MRTYKPSVLLVATLVSAASALGAGCADDVGTSEDNYLTDKPQRFAPDQIGAEDNWYLWSEYCIGDANVRVRPTPNYENALVMQAAQNLSQVAAHSFSLYSDISSHHKTEVPAAAAEAGVSKMAHEFLGYLCGEFRDRATMVEAKVKWIADMNYLDDEDDGQIDPGGDPWKQMKARDYKPYLSLSSSLWSAKQQRLSNEGRRYMQVGSRQVDTPVPPQTVCETKYMFDAYVRQGKSFDSLETFEAGYAEFREQYCNLPDEEDYYYDFRGDSNIKPNSPESNGMIWLSRTIARQCDSRKSAEPYQQAREQSSLDSAVCQRYFHYPFTSRWNAARAGLATWVLVDPNAEGLDSNSTFTIFPRSIEDENYIFGDKSPYRAKTDQGDVVLLEGFNWRFGAFGLPELHQNDHEKIHTLLQLAVDRHTDWYDSGYDDLMPYKNYKRDQAYSPFVASSYEMSKSDHFVTPGTTVPVIDPTSKEYKHWMFVFRVHKDNWYNPERLLSEETPVPNFDRYWFDETSFGETGLANSERAWDRLGTALEDELDAVLYLHNLPAY